MAHNGAAIVATVGSIIIPWMKRSKASGETAAIVLSGNAGVGATFPFSGAFFILLAAPTVLPVLSAGDIVATVFVTGAWMVGMRLRASFKVGWPSLVVLGSIAVPILLTAPPTADFVSDRIGIDAPDAIPLLIWLPIVMLLVGLLVERKLLPKGRAQWWDLFGAVGPKLGLVGVTMISAFAASNVLKTLGLDDQLKPYLEGLTGVSPLVAAIVVGVVIVVVAGPLNTTSTVAAVGPVAFAALTASPSRRSSCGRRRRDAHHPAPRRSTSRRASPRSTRCGSSSRSSSTTCCPPCCSAC
nr:TRAP transporter permease [Amycolatopsis sp. WAC 04182]